MSGPNGPNNPDEQWSRGGTSRDAESRGDGQDRSAPQQPYQGQQYGQQPYESQQYGQQPYQGQQYGQQPYESQQYGQQPFPPQQYPHQGQYQPQQYGQPYPQGHYPQGQYPPQQYGQPYPQGQYPQGQYLQGQSEQPAGRGRSKLPLYIAAGVVVLAIVGVLIFAFGRTTYLDRAAAESGVESIVVGTYGAAAVSGVSCPDDMTVEQGASFECSLEVDGAFRTVTLTMTDDDGTYVVSRPR